jgi:hypothetical protein
MLDRIVDGRTDLVFDFLSVGNAAKSTDSDGVSLIKWCAYCSDVSAVRLVRIGGQDGAAARTPATSRLRSRLRTEDPNLLHHPDEGAVDLVVVATRNKDLRQEFSTQVLIPRRATCVSRTKSTTPERDGVGSLERV